MKDVLSIPKGKGPARRLMRPLIVSVVGAGRSSSRVIPKLAGALTRRGFKVEIRRGDLDGVDLRGSDVVLVTHPMRKLDLLAERLERDWTELWMNWYSASRKNRGKGGVRC